MDVQGTSAIVTGGASGLGAGTARALAAAGAKVAIFDMNMDAANQVAAEIGGMAIECDVSSAASAEAAVAAACAAISQGNWFFSDGSPTGEPSPFRINIG